MFEIPEKAKRLMAERGIDPDDPKLAEPRGERQEVIEDQGAPRSPLRDTELGGQARARTTDPGTSHAAAASVGDLRESQEAVLAAFKFYGAITDESLCTLYGAFAADHGMARQSDSGLRTRRSELVDRGLIRDSGRRMALASGRNAIIWEVV